jgi:SAM-dependent methyltransferase
MVATHDNDDEQGKFWNGSGGRAWVDAQQALDRTLKPMEDFLLAALAEGSGPTRVLDVGCGTGSTTLAIARLLGSSGSCVGIDISAPMLAVARARAERERTLASFVLDSAQIHAFEPASFDMILSRFGVMFFDDPVRAFANLRHAARAHARLLCIAWRSPEENPFMTTAERAAAPLLNIPAREANAPGPFAFADRQRVERILAESGWTKIDIRAIDFACTLPERDLSRYLTRLGPLGRVFEELDERAREQVIDTVRAAFDPYVHGPEVRFTAACWALGARASS